MIRDLKPIPARGMIVLMLVLANTIILKIGFVNGTQWYLALLIAAPLLIIAVVDIIQKRS